MTPKRSRATANHVDESTFMKHYSLVAILCFHLLPSLYAQQSSLRLISPAGGYQQSASANISYSIGEPVIGTITAGGYVMHQGFQQPDQAQCTIDGYNAFPDTLRICGTTYVLDAGASYSSYQWGLGETTQKINASTSGFYKVTVRNAAGCTGTDSVYLSIQSVNILNADTTLCSSAEIWLSVDSTHLSKPICDATQLPANLKTQLSGFYAFCGNANDISGNNQHGVVNGAVATTDRFGNAGGAYAFASGTQRVTIPLTQSNVLNYTVSAWFKTTQGGTILGGRGSNGENGLTVSVATAGDPPYTGRLSWIGDNNYGGVGKMSKQRVDDGQWHHFVGTFAGSAGNAQPSQFTVYIDGVLVASDVINSATPTTVVPVNNNNTQLLIGNHQRWTDRVFKGSIDEVGVWNRALTSTEVAQLYGSNRNVTWSTGATTARIKVTPSQSQTYYASISDGVSTCRDSVRITVAPISSFNPLPDRLYSREDSLPLDAGSGFAQVLWNTAATSQRIAVKYTGGYRVTVTNTAGCTASDSVFVQFPDTVGLHVSTVNGLCNQQVDLPVRATAFRQMMTMQGSVNWNASDLRLDSISGYGPAAMGMNVANFGLSPAGIGRITFSWNDPSGNGLSLADSTTVFTLRFTALGTTVRSVPVTITGTPTPLEFYDAGLVKKSNVQTAGGVNISCEFTISGKVLTPLDQGVRNVTVTLTGGTSPQTAKTDSAGNYSFKILPGTYTLTPLKGYEQNKTNGVSTLDIALVQAHILQKTPFNAAYKVIAGDANNSQVVTTADILSLRKLILGTDTTLPDNRLWALVDGSQTFANPQSPFPFSSTKTFTNQSTNVSHTFRAIKIGDVNYDRNPLLDQAPSGDTLRLFGEWIDTEDGYVTLKLRSRAVSGLLGWQSTLRWDAKQLQLQSVNGLISHLGIGERWKDDGYLTMSWNDPRAEGLSFTDGVAWMELKFRKTSALQRTGIFISEEKLGTEAFNGNYQSMGVNMEPIEWKSNNLSGLLRVYPNPATQFMNVEWKMARAGAATVRLLDAQGRVVHVQRGEYGAGIQRVMIKRNGAWSVAGTWLVQVEVDGEVRNVPVVLVGE
jgi:hypothetical protein